MTVVEAGMTVVMESVCQLNVATQKETLRHAILTYMTREKKQDSHTAHAYIDGANLHKGIKELGWELDYARFRVWLTEKYNVRRAYIFIGLIPTYSSLYTHLQEAGYTLIFKETVHDGAGKPKGNCDADLVLKTTQDVYERACDSAVIVASDGDYASLVSFLMKRNALRAILSPAPPRKCSVLLKHTNAPILYLERQKGKVEKRERGHDRK
jgi:uncharacterized LabA/DUF88 family protein